MNIVLDMVMGNVVNHSSFVCLLFMSDSSFWVFASSLFILETKFFNQTSPLKQPALIIFVGTLPLVIVLSLLEQT